MVACALAPVFDGQGEATLEPPEPREMSPVWEALRRPRRSSEPRTGGGLTAVLPLASGPTPLRESCQVTSEGLPLRWEALPRPAASSWPSAVPSQGQRGRGLKEA